MYEYIKGILIEVSPSLAIVETNSVGYNIFIPATSYQNLPNVGNLVLFYISFVVKEDSHTLYGFLEKRERDLFEKSENGLWDRSKDRFGPYWKFEF